MPSISRLETIVLPAGAYKNKSNAYLFIYGTDSVTMTDESGNTVDIQSLPCWLPPNFTITPSTNARLFAVKSANLEDFRGFLSRAPTKTGALTPTPAAFSVGTFNTASFVDIAEMENVSDGFGQWFSSDGYYWKNPVGGNSGQTTGGFGEAEAWTHS